MSARSFLFSLKKYPFILFCLAFILTACGGSSGSTPISATAITTAQSLTVGTAIASFSPLTASGGATPYTYSVTTGALPAGLSLNASTGAVTGNPTALYTPANVVFSVHDANGVVASTTSTVRFAVVGAPITGAESVLHNFGANGGGDGANPSYGSLIQASDGSLYGMTSAGGGAYGAGAVFKVTPAGVETVLHSFVGGAADGAMPYGSLIQANDGNLYGVTYSGGLSNRGVVFKITLNGTLTILHSFSGSTNDGAMPYGSLIQASDGNLYGTTYVGGANNLGTAFKITPTGTFNILYSFGSANDGVNPLGKLVQASDGNFYGMTYYTGTGNSGFGTIFQITPTGTKTVLHTFSGTGSDGANPHGSLIQANDGNLYGMTFMGGTLGLGSVFQITTTGTYTPLYSFATNTGDGYSPYGNLIQAGDGNLYGLTASGGTHSTGVAFKITTTGTETVLHTFGGPSDGASPQGSLIQASDGSLYGMTYNGGANSTGVVFKIN